MSSSYYSVKLLRSDLNGCCAGFIGDEVNDKRVYVAT